MKIAVNTRFLLKDYLEGYGYFIYETFTRITKNHPEHEFLFIFDRPFDKRFILNLNVKAVFTGPPLRHPLLWKFWYDVKIPAILKKYKPDVFVSCDGFCSLLTNVPQCLVVHDLSFLHYPSFIKKTHLLFYKRYMPKFFNKANSLATLSEFSKQDIIAQYKIADDKIDVVFNGVKEIFHPVTNREKQITKEKYTEGKEYFVYAGAIDPRKNLINLLKAFSVFKKRQQTNMKLVLAGKLTPTYKSFVQSLESYKYRSDVVMAGYIDDEEFVKVIGSSYAFIYPSFFEGFGASVLEAMRCEIPVITSRNSAMQEIAKDAAIFANPNDYNDIADKMMHIYKDENLRNELIQKGKKNARQYDWDKTSGLLWQTIMKAMG